jgi:AcrR family transcriptional regulator
MVTKGELTRHRIIERAASLFNRYGYVGTSMGDIVRDTGLEIGGIYNHFKNKEDLAFAAFDYAASIRGSQFIESLQKAEHAADQLIALAEASLGVFENPDLPGGCPVMNTAVESDDANPALKLRAQSAMSKLLRLVEDAVQRGLDRHELREGTDPQHIAVLMISTLEGALMMSKLYEDRQYLLEAIAFLTHYIETELRV